MSRASYVQPPCHCASLRQATRQITQLYDQHLAPVGLRATQYTVMRIIRRLQPATMQALADRIVMDRTTLTRALRPLLRDGYVEVASGRDARTRVVSLTETGEALLSDATDLWEGAQAAFEVRYGARQTQDLRGMLERVVTQVA